MGGFLPVVVGIKGADGERLDKPDVNGDHAPIMLKLGDGLTGVSGTPGPGGITEIQLGGTASIAFDDHAEFRAVNPSSLVDGEIISFKSPPGTYVYSIDQGAGQPDDDNITLKLTDVLLGSPGRAFNVNADTVPTIAALRLAKFGLRSVVRVVAYAALGDGGGGAFYANATSDNATRPDNGGTIIVPTGLPTGCWERQMTDRSVVNVRWFGAKGDGVYVTGRNMTATQDTLTMSGLSSSDIGKLFYLEGAGTAGAWLITTIANVVGTTVTLAAAAGTTVTGKRACYATNDDAAFGRAKAFSDALKGASYYMPRGVYGLTATFVIAKDGQRICGEGAGANNNQGSVRNPISKIQFFGAGNALFFDGGTGASNVINGIIASDFAVSGTDLCTIAIRCRSVHHAHFSRLQGGDCTVAALKWEFGVSNVIDEFRCSGIEDDWHPLARPQYGMWLTKRNTSETFTDSDVNVAIVEEASVAGIFYEAGNNVVFTAGTCETGAKGIVFGAEAIMSTIIGMDNESNADVDYELAGFGNTLISCLGTSANGALLVFTTDHTTDTFQKTAHGLVNGTKLVLSTDNTLPAGVIAETIYFVVNKTTDTFQLATKTGGSAVPLTNNGTGTHSYSKAIGGITLLAGSSGAYGCTVISGQFRNVLMEEGSPSTQINNFYNTQYMASYTDRGNRTDSIGMWCGTTGAKRVNKFTGGVSVEDGLTVDTVTATSKVSTDVIDTPLGDLLLKVAGVLAAELYAGGLALYKDNLLWTPGATPLVAQQPAASGSGKNLPMAAQTAAVGSNGNGGDFLAQGGQKDGSGRKGGARLQLAEGNDTIVHATEPVVGQRVLGMLGAVTSTEMPANTGDLVGYWANAATPPTAKPVGGAAPYARGGAMIARGSGGNVTTMAASGAGVETIHHVVAGTVQTVGATTQGIVAWDASSATESPTGVVLDNCTFYVEVVITGKNGTGHGTQKIARGFKKNSGTLAAIDAAIITVVAGTLEAGIVGATFNIVASGGAIIVQATGVAAQTIDWSARATMDIYKP